MSVIFNTWLTSINQPLIIEALKGAPRIIEIWTAKSEFVGS